MKGLMRDNLCMAKRFSDTVRYIDHYLLLIIIVLKKR